MGKLKELDYVYYSEEHPLNTTPWDPNENVGTQIMTIGASRRTTVIRPSSISGGPTWPDGKRKALFTGVNEQGEVEIYQVETSSELSNLPSNAINIHMYMNLLASENAEVAAELSEIVDEIEYHTAHHTPGADKGDRLKAILQKRQLDSIVYQDKKIGLGIEVPPPMSRAVDTYTPGDDGVPWN